ncbi:MAG: hypothetical protein JXB07_00895 [Anaerolineae bacterium]|nr:hypothetical protein [Anaerolineae bacterium]
MSQPPADPPRRIDAGIAQRWITSPGTLTICTPARATSCASICETPMPARSIPCYTTNGANRITRIDAGASGACDGSETIRE